ncbi:MAG: hypothetical protein K9G64_01925 [Bacteroidia bacterium]|nr:hypothetical protein [Bacteroidia bacterium]
MKKTIQSFAIAAFAISFTFTSCSKDETTAPSGPTVSLTDSTGTGIVDTSNFFTSTWMTLQVTPSSGTTIESIKSDIKVNGVIVDPGTYEPVDATEKNGLRVTIPVDFIVSQMKIAFGKTVTFVINVKDNNGLIKTAELTYNVKVDHTILASTEIELGAQSNTAIPYKFVGLANNFATYTAGTTGTAKANSSLVDFVYYYGTTDKNAFAAPSNPDGAKIIWNSEINMWPVQNRTKFLASTVTPTEFDNIKNTTKVDDTFITLDFTTGTTDKITSLAVGSVYAFQTAAGVKGLAKFTAISADATGSTKVVLICQN